MEPEAKRRKLREEPDSALLPSNQPKSDVNVGEASIQADFLGIPGLKFIKDFISKEEENALLRAVDAQPWDTQLSRRVQHYGYRYDYKARSVPKDAKFEPLPAFVESVIERLRCNGFYTAAAPDQLIVNEYEPGQGIASHTDASVFGDEIVSISLGGPVAMDFSNGDDVRTAHLRPRCAVIMSGPARNVWKHGITKRKKDKVDGHIVNRNRRVSLTFRTVKRPT